jgi:hypothetical protein
VYICFGIFFIAGLSKGSLILRYLWKTKFRGKLSLTVDRSADQPGWAWHHPAALHAALGSSSPRPMGSSNVDQQYHQSGHPTREEGGSVMGTSTSSSGGKAGSPFDPECVDADLKLTHRADRNLTQGGALRF